MIKLRIGTYRKEQSQGLYACDFNTETKRFEHLHVAADLYQCTYLYHHGAYLYALSKHDDKSGVAQLIPGEYHDEIQMEVQKEYIPACFIGGYQDMIFTCNYHENTCIIYRLINERLTVVKKLNLKDEAHCHQAVVKDGCLFIVCLGQDRIAVYDVKTNTWKYDITFMSGWGPRHMQFMDDDLYVISEYQLEVCHLKKDEQLHYTAKQFISTLPEGEQKEDALGAAIRLHPELKLLYVSNRGHDSISVIDISGEMKLIQNKKTSGQIPRDFNITPDGKYLFAAHQKDGAFIAFSLDEHGLIQEKLDEINIPEGVCVCFL